MARSSAGRRDAAPHARDHGIGAVLLDVGVVAFVHEAALAVVAVVQRPVGQKVVVQRRAAGGAAADRAPAQLLHDGRDGLEAHRLDQAAHILVRVVGAFAHRRVGVGGKAVAEGQGHDLLDQPGAGTAAGAGLGEAAHRVEGGGAALDCLDDLSLADAVAATDLRLRRQGCNGCQRVRLGTSGEGGAEDQRVAVGGHVGAGADLVEEPGAIGGVAIHDGADQAVALKDQALVDAAAGVAEDDVLAARGVGEIARAEEVAAGDLQLGRGLDRLERRRLPRQRRGQHLGLIVERRDEAEELAVMLGAFAKREDRRDRWSEAGRSR